MNSPYSVSINDAISIVLNMSYQPGNTSLPEMIGYFREEAESKRDGAKNDDERRGYAAQAHMHLFREGLARALIDALEKELHKVHVGHETLIEVDGQSTPGEEKLVTASVLAWAENIGFGISNWSPPRLWRRRSERVFSTEYLDILDDVIATWFEEGGAEYIPNVTPKKELLKAWIKEKYGEFSDRVIDSMATMLIHQTIQ
jgi:hypothetical protein